MVLSFPFPENEPPRDESIVSVDAAISVGEQRQGLDWVHWLLRSVRQRCDGIVLEQLPFGQPIVLARAAWREFVKERFPMQLAPLLLATWEACSARALDQLLAMDEAWDNALSKAEAERSRRAGHLLLKRTTGARFQGALGHYRTMVNDGQAAGHIGLVWPCVAHLFQLPPAVMLAEYLRLEWETSVREHPPIAAPVGTMSTEKVVQRALLGLADTAPEVLRRRRAR